MRAPHLQTGQDSEHAARVWLEAQGLTHIASNYRCRFGELDLIMREQLCLVIVEVRYRRTTSHGGALGSITRKKQMRIARAAQHFLQNRRDLKQQPLRFDVIALSGTGACLSFEWRRQAFCFDSH
jgi:putative endonuclease